MTNCPPKLRGDLSKWLYEINTGVYVGNVSARVRDALWDRVCQNIKDGQATMVFSASGEQNLDFRTHNTTWKPKDFDGIKLMQRPLQTYEFESQTLKPGFSKASKQKYLSTTGRTKKKQEDNYTVIDLETTGLNADSDLIIEYGALRIREGVPAESFSTLVKIDRNLPAFITDLTGIEDKDLIKGAVPKEALSLFLEFIGNDALLGHNISFDMDFLRSACNKFGISAITNKCIDLQKVARKKVFRIQNYKLLTLAEHLKVGEKVEHRALADCKMIYQVYCKLNEIGQERS